jgi:hypothetical protein
MLCGQAAWSRPWFRPTARALVACTLAGFALELGACSSSDAPSTLTSNDGAGGRTSGGSAAGSSAGDSLTLDMEVLGSDGQPLDVMNLKPAAVANVVVHLTPPSARTFRFALLGTPLDAVLGATDATSDVTTGDAQVTLVAPSTPTTFSVRASTTGGSTTKALAVPKKGMALLSITPQYAGERVVNSYVASATENVACADLPGAPPADNGDLLASADTFPITLSVPTDMTLAVVLRAADFAWGCTTVSSPIEGIQNDVEVVMTNVPIKLDTSDVDFALTLDAPDALDAALADSEQAVLDAIVGSSDDDVAALLDTMAAQASKPSTFRAARASGDWDTSLRTELGASATTVLRAPLAAWMQNGTGQDATQNGLEGSIHGMQDGAPTVSLTSVFGVSASRAGFAPTGTPSWSAAADDGVLISVSMTAQPATFLLAAAEQPALDAVTGAKNLAGALASTVSCTTVAATLSDYSGCNTGCIEQLCEHAVQSLLDGALSADEPASLAVAFNGYGSVGPDAELASFGGGDWVGHWSVGDATAELSGPARGYPPGSQ